MAVGGQWTGGDQCGSRDARGEAKQSHLGCLGTLGVREILSLWVRPKGAFQPKSGLPCAPLRAPRSLPGAHSLPSQRSGKWAHCGFPAAKKEHCAVTQEWLSLFSKRSPENMPMGEKEGAKARSCFLSSNGWKCHKNPIHGAKVKPFCCQWGNCFCMKTHLSLMKGSLSKRKAP